VDSKVSEFTSQIHWMLEDERRIWKEKYMDSKVSVNMAEEYFLSAYSSIYKEWTDLHFTFSLLL